MEALPIVTLAIFLATLQLCCSETCKPNNFIVKKHTIIRTQDSIANGASVIKSLQTKTKEACERKCCESTECSAAIFETTTKKLCYLFNCGIGGSLCEFEGHRRYMVAIKSTKKRQSSKMKSQPIIVSTSTVSPAVDAATTPPPPPPPPPPATVSPVARQRAPVDSTSNNEAPGPPSVCRYPSMQFQCRDITKSPHCIAVYDRCDGIPHCGDGSDEVDCPSRPDSAAAAAAAVAAAHQDRPSVAAKPKNYDSKSATAAASYDSPRSQQRQPQPSQSQPKQQSRPQRPHHTGKVAEHHMLAPARTPAPPGSSIQDLPGAQGHIQLNQVPSAPEDQLPSGPDSFLKGPSRYGGGSYDTASDLDLLRKSAQQQDDWDLAKGVWPSQRWQDRIGGGADYDRLPSRLEPPDTIYNLDKSEKPLDKSVMADDADYYRLGAAYADRDRDPDSAAVYDGIGSLNDWKIGGRRREGLGSLTSGSSSAEFADDSDAGGRRGGRRRPLDGRRLAADEAGGLDRWRASTAAPPTAGKAAAAATRRPRPRQPSAPAGPLYAKSRAQLAELAENYRQSRTAVVALALGLGLSLVAVLFLTCRIRQLRGRMRRGKALTSDEADYLINGMYL